MRWKKLFTPVEYMEPDAAKAYLDSHREGTYTLLDVRQPKEYEEFHLPGAKLIPVAQLSDRMDELKTDEPVIVYCAVGGRSRAAAQLLAGRGFDTVYNLKGGINAWEGKTAATPVDLGELSLSGEETVFEIIALIYAMESGLEQFYQVAAEKSSDTRVKELLEKLSRIETRHKEKLEKLFETLHPGPEEKSRFAASANSATMEGGFDIQTFLAKNTSVMQTPQAVLDMAMMLEVHGLDLYLRYARATGTPASQKVLLDLAEEEKAHLRALGDQLEKTL